MNTKLEDFLSKNSSNEHRFKIIIIEDDESLSFLIRKRLIREGFLVDWAINGNAALTKITGTNDELLLVDYNLPDMSGKEFIEKITTRFKKTPYFIVMNGILDKKIAAEMIQQGARDYIVKKGDFINLLIEKLKQTCLVIEKHKKLEEAEEILRKQSQLLKETGHIAKVGGWELNLDNNTVLFSEISKNILEAPSDYLPSLEDAFDFYPTETRPIIEKAVQQAIKTGTHFSLELPIVTFKDRKIWIHLIGNPEMKAGKCVRLHGAFQDITERKKVEEKLRMQNIFLERTEKIAHVGSWEWDIATDTVSWSDELFNIFKLDPKKGAPRYAGHAKIFTSESRIKEDEAVQKCLDTGEPFELDLEIIRGDGQTAYCTSRGFAKKDENGKIIGMFGSFQDLSDRIIAEEQLKALNQQLLANEQQLRAANQQLQANEQELQASNQQLRAHEQQLIAANLQLKESEKELRKSKETALKYLNIASEIILTLDTEGNIRMLNENGSKLLGYEVGELIGKDWFSSCLPEEQEQEVRNTFQQTIKTSVLTVSHYESKIKTKSGTTKTILWHNSILEDENGKTIGVLSSGENITERVEAEASLAASESFLKAIFDNSLSAIVVADDEGNYISANEAAAKLFGYPLEKLLKMKLGEIFYQNRQRAEAMYRQFLEREKESGEIEFITSSREQKFVHYSAIRIRKDFNLSILHNITESKKAEQELIKAKKLVEINEERIRKSQEVGHIGSWEFNLETGEFWGSDESKRIYNLDLNKKDFSAEEVVNLVVEKDKEKVNQAMIDLVNNNKAYDIIFEITPKNTTLKKSIHSIAELQKDENGNPLKVTGVLIDITLQKSIENNLIEAKEKAEEADHLKSAFLANMSHEIRTPMNGILGFTELLKEPNLSGEEQQRFIEIIQKSGNRMLATVNDLIDISKIETGQMELAIKEFDISAELESQFHFFQAEAKKKGIKLSLENTLPESCNLIQTDLHKFNSILTNLIKNALKYTDEGSIHLCYGEKEGYIEFSVKDSGVGIPKDRLKAIFDRFVQADIADTRALEGSGLGLTISKAYAEMMGGKIEVKSEEGIGSTFYFSLPLQKTEDKKTDESPQSSYNQAIFLTKKPTILVAEDDEVSFQHLTIILKDSAKEIIHAKSGIEAIEAFKDNRSIDIILMDIKMPQINGYEATRRIRQFNKDVIIIAQTAFALTGDYEKAIEAGCNDYITKPINRDKLSTLITKWFE